MAIKHVMLKLGNMRKEQDFIVYPKTEGDLGRFKIQSDHRIALIDPETKKGILSVQKQNGAYGIHLSPALGAMLIDVTDEIIQTIRDAQPKSGDSIGPGVTIA